MTNTETADIIITRALKLRYVRIAQDHVPAGLRWDVPPECQGQIVEYAYADSSRGRAPAAEGDEYLRRTDRTDGPGAHAYYRRVR